jgi:N-acetylglucosaminyldiphosphoundecaprenol N-acetyl-beta-D-mannosaminyltransferase
MGKFKRIKLMGLVPFDDVSGEKLVGEIISLARQKRKVAVLNMNAYGVVTFMENKKYARIIRSAHIIYPDGWGPVYASKYLKAPLQKRVNVGDFIGDLLSGSNEKKIRLFLLGSEKNLVRKTVSTIRKKYKKLGIAGYHDGYFEKIETENVCLQIRRSKPNLVLIGMGLPLQEYFIHDNWNLLPPAVYMGIGGAFNYIAGTKKRAPIWMRDNGMEWIYRLMQEPGRLWKRYTFVNIKFIIYLIKYLITGKAQK